MKLLIGTGRARRGEVLAGGQLVRSWTVQCLVRAPSRAADAVAARLGWRPAGTG